MKVFFDDMARANGKKTNTFVVENVLIPFKNFVEETQNQEGEENPK
jgi:hypothetical protein